jgi:hypothetical protein
MPAAAAPVDSTSAVAPASAAVLAPATSLGTPSEDWSVVALRARAREVGLVGYSKLTKAQLVAALNGLS